MRLNIFRKKIIEEKRIIKKVILYSISYDLLSRKMKCILDDNKIKYEEIEIEKDYELSKELLLKDIDTFPCLDVDGELIKGINIEKINKIFGLKLKNRMNIKDRIGYAQI